MNDQTLTLPLDAIESALSAIAGEAVELISRSLGESSVWLVAPVDRRSLTSRFWVAVRASDGQGAWDTPGEALAGFCSGTKGWMALAEQDAPKAAEAFLREHLGTGPVPAAHIYRVGAAVGISEGQMDRAARRLGVNRRKASMLQGWLWSLDFEASSDDFEGWLQPSS